MSVTFQIISSVPCECLDRWDHDTSTLVEGDDFPAFYRCEHCWSVNVGNRNARDLLKWLGLPIGKYGLIGTIERTELLARCNRRLWDEPRNHDPELPAKLEGRYFDLGRSDGYLRSRTQELKELCENTTAEKVGWS